MGQSVSWATKRSDITENNWGSFSDHNLTHSHFARLVVTIHWMKHCQQPTEMRMGQVMIGIAAPAPSYFL